MKATILKAASSLCCGVVLLAWNYQNGWNLARGIMTFMTGIFTGFQFQAIYTIWLLKSRENFRRLREEIHERDKS